ncbi:MAG: hypothetical protein ABL903_16700 [Methylococcales bacterium]
MTEEHAFNIAELQQKAASGDAQAQFGLALCYVSGIDVKENPSMALDWLNKAAEQGDGNAQAALGFYHLLSKGIEDKSININELWARGGGFMWSNDDLKKIFFEGAINPTSNLNSTLKAWAIVKSNSARAKEPIPHWANYDDPAIAKEIIAAWDNLDSEEQAVIKNNGSVLHERLKLNEAKYCDFSINIAIILTIKMRADNGKLAVPWLKKAAEQHHVLAIYWLGRIYRNGIEVPQNDGLAFEYFKNAAEEGIYEAQYWLASCYFFGTGCEENQRLAFDWLTKSVKTHDNDFAEDFFEAYLLLGMMFKLGKGVEQSDEQAFKWYKKAAEIEGTGAEAQFCLARCYDQGIGVEPSYKLAFEWYKKAAEQSHSEAKNWLSEQYFKFGVGCHFGKDDIEPNDEHALAWFIKAAELGSADALWFLGILYDTGKGVEQSHELAFEWFKKAVERCENNVNDKNRIKVLANKALAECYEQGKGVEKNEALAAQIYQRINPKELQEIKLESLAGIMEISPKSSAAIEILPLRLAAHNSIQEFDLSEEFVEKVFEDARGREKIFKEICLTNIKQAKILIKQKEEASNSLHEKEREMLSFFTHTMRNALATAPESLRQAIHLLGGDVYEKDTKHYQAINKIAALFSTLSLTDCLIDTFKQSISDPQEFKHSWQMDHSGEATPKWVIASALRQSLNRIIFMSDTTELRKLLNNPETPLIKTTRKSFIEEILPLNVDNQGVGVFYDWTLKHIPAVEVSITGCDKLNFGVNQIRFSLLFAITSELILNALKYWDGENRIHISWQLAEQGSYVFSVTNNCKANATSNLAGTHKGLAFIKRLVELLGEQAQFICKSEDQLFTAELILNKTLFDEEV